MSETYYLSYNDVKSKIKDNSILSIDSFWASISNNMGETEEIELDCEYMEYHLVGNLYNCTNKKTGHIKTINSYWLYKKPELMLFDEEVFTI